MHVSRQLKSVAALGILSSAVWASTYATFSDQATATSSFSSGSIDLLVSSETDDAHDFTTLSVANLKPGDTSYAALPVANAGTLPFTYDLTTSATGALAPELDLGVRVVAGTCSATTYGAAASVVASSTTLGTGVTFTGRPLAAGSGEVLCFRVELPVSTGDSAQAQVAAATFTLAATQS